MSGHSDASLADAGFTWRVDVPEGSHGCWRVERFQVDAKTSAAWAHTRFVQLVNGQPVYEWPVYAIPPGVYTRLVRRDPAGPVTVMSDTPGECADHAAFVAEATARGGHVLLGGLGLGAVLAACLASPRITHATVIERSADVLALVGPHYQTRYADRLRLVHGDVFSTPPEQVLGPPQAPQAHREPVSVWWDVWDDISPLYLPQMQRLLARWAPQVTTQACWGEREARAIVALGWRPGDVAVRIG